MRLGTWAALVQCLLALSWTVYVVFLPGLLTAVGIEKKWVIWVLIADQAVFAVTDWLAGAYADRLNRAFGRIGRPMIAVAVVSSLLLLAMPWIARTGQPVLLIVVLLLWSATSSSLRAPVLSLLARLAFSDGRSRALSLALFGTGFATAMSPWLSGVLRGLEPNLPMAVSALSLIGAAALTLRVEPAIAAAPPVMPAVEPKPGESTRLNFGVPLPIVAATFVAIAGLGMQVQTALFADQLYRKLGSQPLALWLPMFWIGFGIGQLVSVLARNRSVSAGLAGSLLLAGAIAMYLALSAGSTFALAASQVCAGTAWGVFLAAMFKGAIGGAGGRGAGSATGLIFSAMALAALLRLSLVAAGINALKTLPWLPAVSWALGGAALLLLMRRRQDARSSIPRRA